MGDWNICMSCGKTVGKVNKDGECAKCVKEANKGRDLFYDLLKKERKVSSKMHKINRGIF